MAFLVGVLGVTFLGGLWATPTAAHVVAAWSAVALVYYLGFAPTTCLGVDEIGNVCRRPTRGLLRNCSASTHPWENARHFLTPVEGRRALLERMSKIVTAPTTLVAALGTFVALISLVVAELLRSL